MQLTCAHRLLYALQLWLQFFVVAVVVHTCKRRPCCAAYIYFRFCFLFVCTVVGFFALFTSLVWRVAAASRHPFLFTLHTLACHNARTAFHGILAGVMSCCCIQFSCCACCCCDYFALIVFSCARFFSRISACMCVRWQFCARKQARNVFLNCYEALFIFLHFQFYIYAFYCKRECLKQKGEKGV